MDKGIKILIAEDDYFVGEEIKRQLESVGFLNTLEASDGEEAIDMVVKHRPDVVLMDIKMPNMSGLDAARNINEKIPTPVIIISAYDNIELIEEACSDGVSAFLTKPPKGDEILRAIALGMARHNDLMEVIRLNTELEKALAELKVLKGIIPICCYCKDIRKDDGAWQQMEAYISDHSDAEFSHGICPNCEKKVMAEEF